jgi:hypothetical protein
MTRVAKPTLALNMVVLLAGMALAGATGRAAEAISLAGEWRYASDVGNAGILEQWYIGDLPAKIRLPGILQSQDYGDNISTGTPWVLSLYDRFWFLRDDYRNYTNATDVKVPFLSQPTNHFIGPAWYQREIEISPEWEGKRVSLYLERANWETRVWLDGRYVGANRSLCAPHEHDLGKVPPGTHRLFIRVDNRLQLPYRLDAHSVSDSLGQTWNGIVGKIELRATPVVWIDDAQIFADPVRKVAALKLTIGNATGTNGAGTFQVFYDRGYDSKQTNAAREESLLDGSIEWETTNTTIARVIKLPDGATWDEFKPALHELRLVLKSDSGSNERTIIYGMRDFKAVGKDFVVNGRKTELRGTHHGGDAPLTGYPPTDPDYWRKVFGVCKEWGLNHVRFHSFCPPDAAFTAADELGLYLQIEPGMWNTFNPGSEMEQMLEEETRSIIRAYGNHPSFVMFSPSNEPKGRWKDVLPKWATQFKSVDPRRLYTSGTGFTDADAPGPLDILDYTDTQRFGRNQVRGQGGWFGRDYSSAVANVNIPVVAHEVGQWCAYPDYDVIWKFKGYARPGNFEIFRDSLAAHGMLTRDREFARASGRFQLECYKEEIEANRRTAGLTGFQLLDLHDYTGQGTALVGLLDPFWDTKGYVTAAEFRKYCGATAPLARLQRRVFTTAEKLEAPVEMAHYGASPLENAQAKWRAIDEAGQVLAQGEWPAKMVPIGKNFALGTVAMDLANVPAPRACKLVVTVTADGGKSVFENDWNFWVYPAQAKTNAPSGVFITHDWEQAEAKLASGGKVLYLPRNADLDWTCPPLDTLPVFWNRLMNPAWGRMLGLWCDTNHPALAEFPTEANCDWQWTQVLRGVRAFNLDRLPGAVLPVVSAIDDWNRNYKLGVVFECRVGRGRLLASCVDLETDLDNRPVARQLRRSLLDYAGSTKFEPRTAVSAEEIRGVMFDSRIMRKLGATVQAPGMNPNAVIDGDPNTFWNFADQGRKPYDTNPPVELTVSFPSAVAMKGVVIMPRQNEREHRGDVKGYALEASEDGVKWSEVMHGELLSTWSLQRIEFAKTIKARKLKFIARSSFGDDTTVAIADIAVIYAGPKLSADPERTMEFQRSRSSSTDVDEGAAPAGTNAVRQ